MGNIFKYNQDIIAIVKGNIVLSPCKIQGIIWDKLKLSPSLNTIRNIKRNIAQEENLKTKF